MKVESERASENIFEKGKQQNLTFDSKGNPMMVKAPKSMRP